FAFSDSHDSPVNTFSNVIISSLPTAGSLTLSGVPVGQGQAIPVGSLANLVFTPATTFANGSPYATFTFQVRDSGSNVAPNANTSTPANTATILVTAVNSAPQGTDSSTTLLEDSAGFALGVNNFGFADPNDNPPNTFLNVKVNPVTPAAAGTLKF